MDLTETFAAINDTLNDLTHGGGARLLVLLHDSARGYVVATEVSRGWDFSEAASDSDKAPSFHIELPESANVSRTLMSKAAGFAIRTKDIVRTRSLSSTQWVVLKIKARRAPLGETRIFQFEIDFTNELVTH